MRGTPWRRRTRATSRTRDRKRSAGHPAQKQASRSAASAATTSTAPASASVTSSSVVRPLSLILPPALRTESRSRRRSPLLLRLHHGPREQARQDPAGERGAASPLP